MEKHLSLTNLSVLHEESLDRELPSLKTLLAPSLWLRALPGSVTLIRSSLGSGLNTASSEPQFCKNVIWWPVFLGTDIHFGITRVKIHLQWGIGLFSTLILSVAVIAFCPWRPAPQKINFGLLHRSADRALLGSFSDCLHQALLCSQQCLCCIYELGDLLAPSLVGSTLTNHCRDSLDPSLCQA